MTLEEATQQIATLTTNQQTLENKVKELTEANASLHNKLKNTAVPDTKKKTLKDRIKEF